MRMWLIIGASIAVMSWSGAASATCTSAAYPYTLANGQTADATQVMADLDCAAIHGLANWTSNVGIGTTAPVTALTVNGTVTTQYNDDIYNNV